MQRETIAIIVLILIVIGAFSVFLTVSYGQDILANLFREPEEEKTIEIGDCTDVHYIGRYASNNTIFDSSYSDVVNKSGGQPLRVFVSFNESALPPSNYSSHSSRPLEMREGFIAYLIGKEEGQNFTTDPIPPEKAYGKNKLKVGDVFTTGNLAIVLNITVEVFNLSGNDIGVKWIGVENFGDFTMPQIILGDLYSVNQDEMFFTPPPYYLWENATKIIAISEENVTVKIFPTKSTNLTDGLFPFLYEDSVMAVFPDATTAEWNDTTVTLLSAPREGAVYNYSESGFNLTFTVENITDDNINISYANPMGGEKIYQLFNKTIQFNRTYIMPRLFKRIPLVYGILEEDLEKAGYSLHQLAEEELVFELEIIEVYKTSQKES